MRDNPVKPIGTGYRQALDRLDPLTQVAGSEEALAHALARGRAEARSQVAVAEQTA